MPTIDTSVGAVKKEIHSIQALRVLAALSVSLMHILGEAGAMHGTPGRSPWPWLGAVPWEAGVDIFFVISGFVMVYASQSLFGRSAATRQFLSRRIARILPIYWAVTTLFLLVALFTPVVLADPFGSWQVVAASYLFLPWQRPDGSFLPIFRLGWTLNYEMFFYMIFAVMIRFPMRRAICLVSATLIGLVLLVSGDVVTSTPQLLFWGDPIVMEFVLGMGIGWFIAEGGAIPRYASILGLAGLVVLLCDPLQYGLPRWLGFGVPGAAMLLACLVPLASSWRFDLLSRVGDASYAIYLIHLFVARGIREVWVRLFGTGRLSLFVLVALLATVVISLLVNKFFEAPMTRVLRRRFAAGGIPPAMPG